MEKLQITQNWNNLILIYTFGINGKYNFRTMYGYDYCSPGRGLSSFGRRCSDPCEEQSSGHYKCHVGGARRELEYCGQFAEDLDYFLKDDIEYSHHGKVCASMCKNNDDQEKYCDEVRERWTYDSVGSINHELFQQ